MLNYSDTCSNKYLQKADDEVYKSYKCIIKPICELKQSLIVVLKTNLVEYEN